MAMLLSCMPNLGVHVTTCDETVRLHTRPVCKICGTALQSHSHYALAAGWHIYASKSLQHTLIRVVALMIGLTSPEMESVLDTIQRSAHARAQSRFVNMHVIPLRWQAVHIIC